MFIYYILILSNSIKVAKQVDLHVLYKDLLQLCKIRIEAAVVHQYDRLMAA